MKKILAVSLVFLVFLLSKHQLYAQTCTDFAVIVGNWGDASLQRFDGTTGNYSNQLATGIGARINSVLQYPSPNGNLYLGGYEEVNVVNAFTGAVSFSFTGGSLSGLTEQIVIGNDGLVYVASEGTGAGSGFIARYNATSGAFIDNFISFPSYQPNGLAQDAAGNWYVGTRNSPNEILKYNSSGVLQGVVTTMGTTQIGGGLKVFNNELYVVTTDSPQTVKVYSLPVTSFPATPVRTLNTGGSTYVGIAFGPDNNMYMADFNNSRVSVWNPTTGTLVRNLTNSSITNPHGVGFTTCTPCTPPTVGTAVATQATCTGSTANSDAKIDVSGISGGDKYSYGTDTTSFTYASATSFTGATISITGLANPSSATTYYVRVYNGSGLCIKTVSVVLQPKSCTAPSTTCVGNLMSNGSFENGTFSAATVDGVTTQVTTYGGSQSIFLPFNSGGTTGAGIMGHPVADFAANIGYWVDASTNTGTGSKDMNRLFAIPSGWGANRCLWPSGGSGFVYTKGNCYRMCFWVAQFDPTNPTNTSPSTFNFETYDHNGVATVAATANNFSVTPTSVDDSHINFTLPASTNVKTTSGVAYTGATGQVVDWKTLNWQYICFDLTPLVDNPKLDIYISTDGVQDNGLVIDGICAVENCTATCTKPTVGTATSTQATCTGSTANSDAKIDVTGISGGDKYSYGTDSTTFTYASATAFTGASINITGLANPSSATTYYVRVYNGADGCYKTVSVVVQPKTCTLPCSISAVTAVAGACSPTTNKFDLTGQITFSNPPTEGVLRVRLPGKGFQQFAAPFVSPLTYTITGLNSDGLKDTVEVVFSAGACTASAIYTAPTLCLPAACVSPAVSGVQTYTSSIPLTRTNWTNQPLTLPKFDDLGGTRVLKTVILTVNQTIRNWGVAESTDSDTTTIDIHTTGTSTITLNGTTLVTNSFTATNYPKHVAAGISVPAQGSWPGDVSGSTLFAMSSGVNADLNNLVDPTLSSTWVTNVTGNPTHDDDMTYFSPVYSDNSKCTLYNSVGDLANFIGTGNLSITASASGSSIISGAGNVNFIVKTAASADVSVTYVYCETVCSKPIVGAATSTQSTCTGSTANSDAKIDVTGISGGDKYSYGTDSTTFTYASATAFTGASISITGLANPSTATTYHVRVYNGIDACYKTVSVVLQPKTCLVCPSTTYPLCPGESYTLSTPVGMTNVQWYKDGVAISAPAGTATSLVATTIGDYVYTGLPSGGTCKDSLCCPVKIVAGTTCCVKPNAGADQDLSCGLVTGQRATSLLNASIAGGVWSSPSTSINFYSSTSNPTFAYVLSKGVFPIVYTLPGGCSDTLMVTFQDLPSSCTDTWVNFATPITVDAVTTNTEQYATIDDVANTIGGELDITLKELVGNGGSGSNVDIFNGVLTWNHGPGRLSELRLDWDGNDNSASAFNPTGLGGLNLSGAGQFQFIINSVDVAKFNIKLRLYTDASNVSESTFSMDQTGNLNANIPVMFNTFSIVSGTGANFSNIGAIQLLLTPKNLLAESNGIDMELACFKAPCLTQCIKPTVAAALFTRATCTGTTANNDAKIDVSGIAGGDRYSYGTDSTSFTYSNATSFTGSTINITGLANPGVTTTYYVRVYNGTNNCFTDVQGVLQAAPCNTPCGHPNCTSIGVRKN